MWTTRVTAFALVEREDAWLMLRHRRLGSVRWELPGGHVEAGETLEQAAARETLEETGVVVDVGPLVATCVHEWDERQQRRLIAFFTATSTANALPGVSGEPNILEASWRVPTELARQDVSPFLYPC